MKNRKKMLKVFLATSMVFSYFTMNNTINAESSESISFPVEFFDVDADGLFFEYMLGAGMDTFGFKDSDNTGPTKGLISPILGEDGNPVYTRSTIENAAQVIHDNLKDLKGDTGLNKYDVFKYFVNKSGAKGSKYENSFGNAENYFYDKGWSLDSDVEANQSNGQIHTGSGKVIWQHEGDGVINKGYKDHLTKTVAVTANTDYTLDSWRGSSTIKYQIKTLDGNVLLDDGATKFNSGDNTQVIFDIYREEDGSEAVKFSIPKLTPDGGEQGENLIGQDGKTFITEGWQSSNYPNATKAAGKLMDGTVYFEQSGDGVLCSKDSSIVLDTDIETNQTVRFRYYLGGNGCQPDGMKIVVLDEDDKVLKTLDLEDTDGFHEQSVDIPEGNGNVKVKVVGKAGSRIAALTITPLGGEFPLGDYDKTEEKYNAGKLKVYQDCNSCMDYAYLRLKNFFNTDFYLNHKTDLYNKMILIGQNRNVDGETQNFYSFSGGNKIKYDTTSKEFYNDDELGQNNGGFFPLDLYGNERHGDNHNYHFGMKVSGSFVYKKGSNQFFNFNGDDDVYIFINGKLVVDLGGAHYAAEGDVDIEKFAEENGIQNGETCEFKMFYLERHTLASTCKIDTNLRIGHLASYQFESENPDLTLPEAIINLTPIDEEEHYVGETVSVLDEKKTFENVEDTRDGYDGHWEFINWDNEEITISEENNVFTGTWRFVPNEYNVTYKFESGTKGKDLPDAINGYLPTDDNTYLKGKTVNSKEPTEKTYVDTINDGTWTFKSWDEESKVVNGNIEFVGTWEFTPNLYKATYEFKSGTEGKELPKEIIETYLPKDELNHVKGDHAYASNPADSYKDVDNDGVWIFRTWDYYELEFVDQDLKFVGTWDFVANDYKATYKFESGTEGKELPEDINRYLPSDNNNYHKGDAANSKEPTEKTYVDTNNDGTWTFKSWDEESKNIVNDNVEFVGTWEFVANEHKVTYEFTSGTEGKELPEDINEYLPSDDNTYHKDDTVNSKEPTEKTYVDTINDGTWTFKSWDKESEKVDNEDVKFVGTWEFVANEHKVTHQFVSDVEGQELPDEVKNLLPTDIEGLVKGDKANVALETGKTVNVEGGKWVLKAWDKTEVTIDSKDEIFVGTWEFIADPVPVDPTPDEPTPVDPTPVDPTPVEPTDPDDSLNSDVLGDKVNNKDNDPTVDPKDEEDSLDSGVLGDKYRDKSKSKHVKTSDDQRILLYGGMTIITLLGLMLLKKKKTSKE